MSYDVRTLEALSSRDCAALLQRGEVGRVVFTVGALPAVVPVTYAVRGETILMRTAADTRLAEAANGQVLAFEIDELDPLTRTGWSIVVTGVAALVTDPAERARVNGVVAPWAPGHNDVFIQLPATVVTGRRIVAEPSPNGASGP